MADKDKERECFEKVLKCKTLKGQFARNIHEVLFQKKDSIDCSGERPDIIIQTDAEVIGIEHCQVDVLFRVKKKKAQSAVGRHRREVDRLVEKYKDKELLDEDVSNGTALESVLDLVEERLDCRNLFDYSKFIGNFRRVCGMHNDNCSDYKARLKDIANGRNITLACLVEIPYTKEKAYKIIDNKGMRVQAMKGIPITKDMLQAIQKMNGFDFVIICMYCADNSNKEKDIICYYFLPCCVMQGVKQQNIRPVQSFELLNAFGLPYKADIRFPKDKYEKGEGSTTVMVEVTPKDK